MTTDDFDCPNCRDAGCIDCTDPGTPIPDVVLADIHANHTVWTTQQLGQDDIKRMFHVVRLLLADNDRLNRLVAGARLTVADCHALADRLTADDDLETYANDLRSCLVYWHAAEGEGEQ